MGIASFFGLGKKSDIKSSTMVGITDTGKKMAEKQFSSGKTFVILSQLNEKSPLAIGDLARESDIDIDEIKARVKDLAKNGVVRIVGMEG